MNVPSITSKVQLLSTFKNTDILSKLHLMLKWSTSWSHRAPGSSSLRVPMMTRMSWAAGLRPGQEIWPPWWPSLPAEVVNPSHPDGSWNEGGRSPGSSSTSRLCAGPVVAPEIRRWPAWRPDTTAWRPRPPGCPRWSVRRLASPERRSGWTPDVWDHSHRPVFILNLR